jgi:hypothetical protein
VASAALKRVVCLPFIRRGLPVRAYPQERIRIGRRLVLDHRNETKDEANKSYQKTEIYIELDVYKETMTTAVPEGERTGEVRQAGTITNDPHAV